MLYLHVYFSDVLQGQAELNKALITIGRSEDCDIRIDNPGVSGHHARIVQEGESYYVEDTDSTNGTSVNGEPVSRKQLEYGDMISIFKHTLKFSPLDKQVEIAKQGGLNTGLADGAGTVEIDVSNLNKLLRQQTPVSRVSLVVHDKNGRQRKRPLNNPTFTIGKDPLCDLVVRGWFVPRTIASIDRRADGYYLVPGQYAQVKRNGKRVRNVVKLEGGDVLLIRSIEICFVEEQPENATE